MRQLVYALRFTGRATPTGPDGSVLALSATAPGVTIVTVVGPTGLATSLEPAPGAEAAYASEVTVTGETSFQEIGTIAFGEGHRLRFATVGSGYLGVSADPSRTHGSAMWWVDGGQGQFAGTTGLITSNFLLDADFTVTDYHLGVLFLP